MATDFLFSAMSVPIFVIMVGLIGSTIYAAINRKFPSIGWEFSARRILFGFTGAALALLLLSYIEAMQMGQEKVGLGHIEASELSRWILFWGFYVFVMYSTIAFLLLTFVGLPLIAALSRIGFASILGVAAICCALAGVIAAFAAWLPVNKWCEANLAQCIWETSSEFFVVALGVGLGFAAFARMPLVRNHWPRKN